MMHRLQERQEEDGGRDGSIETILERQRELRTVVKELGAQLENLLEETVEMRGLVARLETAGRQGGKGGKYQGAEKGRYITKF